MLQTEYDAVLLELFDTRRALEETRRELSQALYQNDAAVRVVARLASERDAAREMVAAWSSAKKEEVVVAEGVGAGQKRRRVEDASPADGDDDEDVGPKPPPVVVEPEQPSSLSDNIPPSDLEAMKAKWKILSKSRRKRPPPPASHATKEQLAEFSQIDKKTLHKSSAKPGITALVVDNKHDIAVSGGRDKQIIVYSKEENRVLATIAGVASKEITCVDVSHTEDGKTLIVTGSQDGHVKAYLSPDYQLLGSAMVEDDDEGDAEQKAVVGVSIHPTGTYALATTRKGTVVFLSVSSSEGEGVQKRAVFREKDADDVQYSCSMIHPDGLILGVGTTEGKLKIWDLKTQKLAQTLEGHEGSVTSLCFSENGYHVVSSSSSGEVLVWDLRKGKTIKTLNQKEESDDTSSIGAVCCAAFDPSGRYLAYGGEKGVNITVVKEWNLIALQESGKENENVTGISWGKDAMSLVTCSDKERAMKYWGPPSSSKGDDNEKEVKMEE